jgi:hypothetical protein
MRRTLNVIRSVVVVLGLGAVAYSGSALVAVPRAASACCNSSEECGDEQVCCDPGLLGEPYDCAAGAPGYCRTACVPNG